jgi:hypothetical protein
VAVGVTGIISITVANNERVHPSPVDGGQVLGLTEVGNDHVGVGEVILSRGFWVVLEMSGRVQTDRYMRAPTILEKTWQFTRLTHQRAWECLG